MSTTINITWNEVTKHDHETFPDHNSYILLGKFNPSINNSKYISIEGYVKYIKNINRDDFDLPHGCYVDVNTNMFLRMAEEGDLWASAFSSNIKND